MAAALTVTPAEVQVGDTIAISGTGFLPSTEITIEIPEYGLKSEVLSDVAGEFSSDDLADKAVGTLTSDGTNVTAADTVTVGAVTYTFRASVAATANEVLIGADAATTLANLKAAINAAAGSGTTYGSATVVNPTVAAGAITATTLKLYAKTGGTAGNALATTEASSHLSYAATTLTGGAASTGVSPLLFVPEDTRPFTVKASDGTTSLSASVRVFSE